MSYQVLARKWRPATFDALVGQTHVSRALVNALREGRLHHAYLFTGTRGVGKTTIARILAKCLNCQSGPTPTPCGVCSACREVDEGRFVDLIEVDAASRTRLEDTRELLDNVQYAPTQGRFKVYLIDEVHMLSGHSFNALLKTLEEPPEHVKFLLATTDPQKLPITVLSRCLQFNLKRLPVRLLANHFQTIVTAEGVPAETEAIQLLAEAADGSVRDGLSLLDQAIAFGDGQLRSADVGELLGTIGSMQLLYLLDTLAAGNGTRLMAAIATLAERALDFEDVLAQLLRLLYRIALHQTIGQTDGDEADETILAAIVKLAQQLSPETIQLFYQIGLTGRRDLSLAPDPQLGFEMLMLRMLAFRPVEQQPSPASSDPRLPGETPAALQAPPRPGEPPQDATLPASRLHQLAQSLNKAESASGHSPSPPEHTPTITQSPRVTAPLGENQSSPPAAITATEAFRATPPRADASDAGQPAKRVSDPAALPNAHATSPAEPVQAPRVDPQASTTTLTTAPNEPVATRAIDATTRELAGSALDLATLTNADWPSLLAQLNLKGPAYAVASQCRLLSLTETEWQFGLAPEFESLRTTRAQDHIRKALAERLGRPVEVHIVVDTANTTDSISQETPAKASQRLEQARHAAAEAAIANDERIRDLMQAFQAEIVPGSIRPRAHDDKN